MTAQLPHPPYDPTDKNGLVRPIGKEQQLLTEKSQIFVCASSFSSGNLWYLIKHNSFLSYETVLRRWPTIITSVIDELHQQCHNLSIQLQRGAGPADVLQARITEALAVVNEISKLKYEMARDRPLKSVLKSPRIDIKD